MDGERGMPARRVAGRELDDRWLRTVPSLREPELRIRYLRLELEQAGLAQAAEAMEHVAAGAEQADARARQVLAAAAPTLTDPAWSTRLDALRAEAARRGHLALSRLLRQRVPAPPGPADPGEGPLATAASGRPLTLGERKAHARRPDRFMLDRLLRDPDPTVIRNVLGNPRITEDDVVRLAARRPGFAVVLEEVAKHPKWSGSLRARLALVLNPYTPTSVAVPLVSLLLRHELREVALATTLPAVVRAAAVELLERRPPIRRGEEGSPTTH
jgi:hypothetical protein